MEEKKDGQQAGDQIMKISKEHLRKIIREELGAQNEAAGDEFPTVQVPAYRDPAEREIRGYDHRPLRDEIGRQLKVLQDRVAAIERKIEDIGMGEPGTPFQESKK